MKRGLFRKVFVSTLLCAAFAATVAFAATGTIDPSNAGNFKAGFLDSSLMSDTTINFGKFTTQSQYNIQVTDSELRGYAWGSSVGWMVMNCADTTSGCSGANGNFKVANNGGNLSGYAWGENTGWINFGPFTNTSISTVKINSGGFFSGTQGSAGYAWSQNFGWIVFDCSNINTCVSTDWRPTTSGGNGGTSGGGTPPGGPNVNNVTYIQIRSIVCDSFAYTPHWGLTGSPYFDPTTAPEWVANSNGHCRFDPGVYFQWGDQTAPYTELKYGAAPEYPNIIGPTNTNGAINTTLALAPTTAVYHIREVLDPKYNPFTYPFDHVNHLPDSAEFYCQGDGKNYDNYDFLRFPYPGETYYCIAFNTYVNPSDYTNPPPITPGGPGTPSNPSNPSTPTDTNNPGNPSNPGTSGNGGTGTTPGEGPTTPPPATTTEPPNNPAESTNEPGLFDGGLQLPPQITEAIGSIIGTIGNGTTVISDALSTASRDLIKLARTPEGGVVTTIASAVGIIGTLGGALATIAIANPFALSELLLLPYRLWTLLLIFFGYKKKNRPWGTVYDSVTKQPIDPAYVVLLDMNGVEVATAITDIDGRYGFSVSPGTYKLVASKTNFVFPSVKLAGRTSDELYNDLYFGEVVTIEKEDDVIIKNIPMDMLKFDWNEFAKNEQHRLSYYRHSDLLIARLSNFFFWLGFAIAAVALLAAHNTYNIVVFIIYLFLFVYRQYSVQFKPKGSITNILTDQPLPFAILRVFSKTGNEITHKVADKLGNYYCLIPNGEYTIVIDRKDGENTYTKISVLEPVTVTKGYLKKDFRV